MSLNGTFRTCGHARLEAVIGTKADCPPTAPSLWVHALDEDWNKAHADYEDSDEYRYVEAGALA